MGSPWGPRPHLPNIWTCSREPFILGNFFPHLICLFKGNKLLLIRNTAVEMLGAPQAADVQTFACNDPCAQHLRVCSATTRKRGLLETETWAVVGVEGAGGRRVHGLRSQGTQGKEHAAQSRCRLLNQHSEGARHVHSPNLESRWDSGRKGSQMSSPHTHTPWTLRPAEMRISETHTYM